MLQRFGAEQAIAQEIGLLGLLADEEAVASESAIVRLLTALTGQDAAVAQELGRLGLLARESASAHELAVIGMPGRESAAARDFGVVKLIQAAQEGAAAAELAIAGFSPKSNLRQDFTPLGAFSYTVPVWSRYIDMVLQSGAASGQTGSGAVGTAGKGGNPGVYVTRTLERGVDIPWSAITITGTVGNGGAQAANSDLAAPNPGGDTTATWNGGSLTAPGATGTVASGQNGGAPGNQSHQGMTVNGGTGGTGNGGAGTAPGGAGAGGNGGFFGSRTRGGAGARGIAVFQARQ